MKLQYSHLDLIAFLVFVACWFGYDWFAKRHANDRPSLLTAIFVFLCLLVSFIAWNDFLTIRHALGQSFLVSANFFAAGADLAELEFGNFF
ncbi:MAG: hypothetical protein EAZ21_11885 [Betaproteobacteria bacterium]|nr:MAG: hypothetical protein EAZ21_11885 [Betaproteobacteria bacterium]